MKCAQCDEKECYKGKDCTGGSKEIARKYTGDDLEILRASAEIEAKHYMKKTRIEELILFAKRMGYKSLGIAFCIGLEKEARILHTILERGFETHSVCCKVCGMDKSQFKAMRLHPERDGVEAICNPIGQAQVLNDARTDLNIILGLCIGHDILFTKHSKAPVTTIAVKDRVLAHNPLGAIYSDYYTKRLEKAAEADKDG
jgi:uncharacterized metal-binding protein